MHGVGDKMVGLLAFLMLSSTLFTHPTFSGLYFLFILETFRQIYISTLSQKDFMYEADEPLVQW